MCKDEERMRRQRGSKEGRRPDKEERADRFSQPRAERDSGVPSLDLWGP